MYFNIENINKSINWSTFNRKAHYNLGRDFTISVSDTVLDKKFNQVIKDETELIVEVDKLLTLWTGTCFKISINLTKGEIERLSFVLKFSLSLSKKDTPTPEIYLTSEANAYGILGITWLDGNELKFPIEGHHTNLKIKATKHIFLDDHSNCTTRSFNSCITKTIYDNVPFNCSRTCLPITVPEKPKYFIPTCQDIEEFKCMRSKVHEILYHSSKERCHTNCTTFEYTGKITYKVDQRVGDVPKVIEWTYFFESKNIEVHEEYLVTGPSELIGYVGGTLGLFIGFSFTEVVNIIIDTIDITYKKLFDVKL